LIEGAVEHDDIVDGPFEPALLALKFAVADAVGIGVGVDQAGRTH
jgi:hypothetical protein